MTKIAFTGAHGVGKTTLTQALVAHLRSNGMVVEMTAEVPRLICDRAGDPTLFRRSNNTPLRQMLILLGQIDIEARPTDTSPDLLVCDRTLLDHWAYTKHFFRDILQQEGVLDLYEQFVAEYCRTYDRVFYLPIEFAPLDDGTRESDLEFQRAIDELIADAMQVHNLPYITVTGRVEERRDQVLAVLQQ